MAKRVFSVLFVLIMVFSVSSEGAFAAQAAEMKEVSLSLYSNLSPKEVITGLYENNRFYIPLETLCELVGGTILEKSDTTAKFSVGARTFVFDVGSVNMEEVLYSENYPFTTPSMLKDGEFYVSALHFLNYIGATVHLDEQAPIQFMVIKRYDIFNAMQDYSDAACGQFFWWDEMNLEDDDIDRMLTNAGVVALINRDSNVFRMMLDPKGIEREAIEDVLLTIVKNEGADYFNNSEEGSELLDTASGILGAEADWFGLIKDAYQDVSNLGEQIGDLADSAALAGSFTNNAVKAFESLKQFDNMTEIQKDLLENTIIAHSDDSKTLIDQWSVVLDAAKNIDKKVKSEYAAKIDSSKKLAESTAYDFLNGAVGAAGANPVSIAWNSAVLLTKLIPYTKNSIAKKDCLYNAYNSSMIQLIANEMLTDAWSDWYFSNGMNWNIASQYSMLTTVKQILILQLKATLTTREYLIQSNCLDDSYVKQMEKTDKDVALLLNKAENCLITGVNMYDATYDDDLSWISNCKTDLKKTNISRVNYYDVKGKLLFFESYAYYDNGLLCSKTLHSVNSYSDGDEYVGNICTLLYLYDENDKLTDTVLGSLTIADWFDENTGRIILDYEYDSYGKSNAITFFPKQESIEQEKYGVDASKTKVFYGDAPFIPTSDNTNWASFYLKNAFNYTDSTEETECRLIFLDHDNVPELWIDYGFGYAGAQLYTEKNGTIDYINIDHGGVEWIESSNIFLVSTGFQGYNSDTIYMIQDGKFLSIAKGDYNERHNSDGSFIYDADGEPVYEYRWDGRDVTEKEYEQHLVECFNKEKAVDIFQNIYTYDQCKLLLDAICGMNGKSRVDNNNDSASDSKKIYQPIIDQYQHAISEEWSGAQFSSAGLAENLSVEYQNPELPERAGYCITDINLDGIDELLISSEGSPYGFYDLYTIIEGNYKKVPLEHQNLSVCKDGKIQSDPFDPDFSFFELSRDNLKFVEGYFIDNEVFYKTTNYETYNNKDSTNAEIITESKYLVSYKDGDNGLISLDLVYFNYSSSTSNNNSASDTTSQTAPNSYNNFISDSIWATLVNNEWVDEKGYSIKFTKNITYYKLKPNATHTSYDTFMGTFSLTDDRGHFYGHYRINDDNEILLEYNTWPNGGGGVLLQERYHWDQSLKGSDSWCMSSEGQFMFSSGTDIFCGKTYRAKRYTYYASF